MMRPASVRCVSMKSRTSGIASLSFAGSSLANVFAKNSPKSLVTPWFVSYTDTSRKCREQLSSTASDFESTRAHELLQLRS